MAVLWRGNEHGGGTPDARYRQDGDATPALPGQFGAKNTFFEKHVRVSAKLPPVDEMKTAVKAIYDARHKSPGTLVASVAGPQKKKKELFGGIKPPANTTLFVTLQGFQEINAWIEKNVPASVQHKAVPILGGGHLVTYHGATNSFTVTTAGTMTLDIRVGAPTGFATERGQPETMQSKIVYHLGA